MNIVLTVSKCITHYRTLYHRTGDVHRFCFRLAYATALRR